MKLSKLTLEWLIYHAQHSDAAGYTELKIIEEINEALSDNTLEIEGYTRDEWIKVVLGDPKTFPPRDKELILAQRNKILGLYQPLPICFEPKEKNFERLPCFRGEFITHWRLAPKPPTEKE